MKSPQASSAQEPTGAPMRVLRLVRGACSAGTPTGAASVIRADMFRDQTGHKFGFGYRREMGCVAQDFVPG